MGFRRGRETSTFPAFSTLPRSLFSSTKVPPDLPLFRSRICHGSGGEMVRYGWTSRNRRRRPVTEVALPGGRRRYGIGGIPRWLLALLPVIFIGGFALARTSSSVVQRFGPRAGVPDSLRE